MSIDQNKNISDGAMIRFHEWCKEKGVQPLLIHLHDWIEETRDKTKDIKPTKPK